MEVVEGDERRRKGGRETNADAKQGHLHTGGGGETKNIKSGQFKMPNIST